MKAYREGLKIVLEFELIDIPDKKNPEMWLDGMVVGITYGMLHPTTQEKIREIVSEVVDKEDLQNSPENKDFKERWEIT